MAEDEYSGADFVTLTAKKPHRLLKGGGGEEAVSLMLTTHHAWLAVAAEEVARLVAEAAEPAAVAIAAWLVAWCQEADAGFLRLRLLQALRALTAMRCCGRCMPGRARSTCRARCAGRSAQ